MIYETVRTAVDDLQTRWGDLAEACGALVGPLPEGHERGLVDNWMEVATERAAALADLPVFLQGHPDVNTILPSARNLFQSAWDTFERIDSFDNAPAVCRDLARSANTAVAANARIVLARLDALRLLLRQTLDYVVSTTTEAGERSNIAGLRNAAADLATYPLLTQPIGSASVPSGAAFGGSSVGGGLAQIADRAVAEVLGRRTRIADTKSFVAALNQAFTCKEVEGHVECTWTGPAYLGQTDLGGSLTGAQASIYQRAKATLDNAMPLLDQLEALRVDADPQEVDAVRAIVRNEFTEAVNEFGLEGGPRVVRLDELFVLLIGQPAGPGGRHGNFELLPPNHGFIRDTANHVGSPGTELEFAL